MDTRVYINNREACSKASDGVSKAAFPDPCWTPPSPPAGPIVVPYPNTAYASTLKDGTTTVFVCNSMVAKEDVSCFSTRTGDEPATQSQPKGVITGVIKGKAYFRTWSPNVKFEGKCVARHEDLMSHNHGSQPGNTDLFYYLSEPISVGNRIWDNVLEMLCWQDNYEKEVSVNITKRYADAFDSNGLSHNYLIERRFKLNINIIKDRKVIVTVRFKTVGGAGVSKKNIKNAKAKMLKGVSKYWNNKFKLKLKDAICGDIELPVRFKILWVKSNEHYLMNIHKKFPREGVTGFEMNVSGSTRDWIYAHEFGHCFGLPDEYAYDPAGGETVAYYKPDGTMDNKINVPYDGGITSDPSSTIMSAVDNTIVLERHCWPIAIEANDIMKNSKRNITTKCEVML